MPPRSRVEKIWSNISALTVDRGRVFSATGKNENWTN